MQKITITLAILLIMIPSLSIGQPVNLSPASYFSGGGGSFGPFATRCMTISATSDDGVTLRVWGDNYSIEVGVVFLENFPNSEFPVNYTLNPLTCLIYDNGMEVTAEFTIPETGDWGLVMHNPRNFTTTISYSWEGEQSLFTMISIVFTYFGPAILGVIALLSGIIWYMKKKRLRTSSVVDF